MKYLLVLALILLSACSKKLPIEASAAFDGRDFNVIGQASESLDPDEGLVFFIEGTYVDLDVMERLPLNQECPFRMGISATDGILTYDIEKDSKTEFAKKEADACALNYATLIEKMLSKKYEISSTYDK
jgi:hypothetical protein